jgi:hypothetical protein
MVENGVASLPALKGQVLLHRLRTGQAPRGEERDAAARCPSRDHTPWVAGAYANR